MSLYDGLGIEDKSITAPRAKPADTSSSWASSLKMLQSQKHNLQARKAAMQQPKRRPASNLAPVVDLKRTRNDGQEIRFNQQTGRMERIPAGQAPGASFLGSEPTMALVGVTDEYDPLRPNDFEEFSKRRREERQKERELEDTRKRLEREDRRRHGDSDSDEEERPAARRRPDSDEEEDRSAPRAGRGGAAIAPPKALLPDEPQDDKPAIDIEALAKAPARDRGPYGGSAARGSVASKIMARMGYKAGQGLGKKEQGMSMALMVEKTSKRGGKIIHERDLAKLSAEEEAAMMPPPPGPPPSTANLMANPSKVILLQNMVGPGEVDEDLEPETAEECTKYGKVIKCMIFEIPEAPDEKAVRIFIEFEQLSAATKALIDLNGRYFGGRTVQACFYNYDKFKSLDLTANVDTQ